MARLSVSVMRVTLCAALVGIIAFGATGRASAGSIIYVKWNASGANNGTSWVNAYRNLQAGLAGAVSGDQVWVAAGTYKPGNTRASTFNLVSGVAIYGGFAGTETLLSQRNFNTNVTVLSCDIGAIGDSRDNCYHVVVGSLSDATGTLDGFTLTGGNANGVGIGQGLGGGISTVNGSPTLNHLKITGNQAALAGGGAYLEGSDSTIFGAVFSNNRTNNALSTGGGVSVKGGKPQIVVSRFSGNSATYGGGLYSSLSNTTLFEDVFNGNSATGSTGRGGGMFNDAGTPSLKTVRFIGNTAVDSGAGMYNNNSSPAMTWVTFTNNKSMLYGGGMYDNTSNPALTDSTFNGNSALVGAGIYNFQSSPPMENVTFSSNVAGDQGGGMLNSTHSDPLMYNLTFSGNQALPNAGGAILNQNFSNPAINDTIFWGDGSEVVDDSTSAGSINLSIVQGGDPCVFCSNIINKDPKLGLLQNNGGQTQTMALGVGSAAIDAGTDPSCGSNTQEDQRAIMRPQGPHCDLGAYEVRTMVFRSQAAYDGWALESGKGTNIGGGANSGSANLLAGDDSLDRRERGFLSFNTAALTNAVTVVRAKLKVLQQNSVGNPFATQGRLLVDLAQPYFGAGPGLVSGDFQASATVVPAGSFGFTLLPNGSWYAAGLTPAALSAINKTGMTQFRLRFASDTYNEAYDFVSFFSGNAGTVPDWPALIVYVNP